MNESDQDAHSKAVDSLLNFETVKYFGNEQMEAGRYDRAMARYEQAAIRIWTSIAWLNIGQIVIFTDRHDHLHGDVGAAVMRGEQTIGDFVLINALLMQLSIPLNFIGIGLSRDQAGADRHRGDVRPARRRRRRSSTSRAPKPLGASPAARRASRTCASTTTRRGRS